MNHILLIDGPDEKGLIHHVTSVLFELQYNIITQDEYVSPDGHFFMRTEFESVAPLDNTVVLELLKSRISNPEINFQIVNPGKKNVILMCTKEHHCISEILVRNYFNELEINVLAVISNHDTLRMFVEKFGIDFHFIDSANVSREQHESQVNAVLSQYQFDYIILAKYMRILNPEFVSIHKGKLINIHHSFLPAFIGANPYKQAYERGVKIIGATAHFVTDDLDEGPIIYQNIKEIDHKYTSPMMAKEGRDVEKSVLIKAIQLTMSDRVFVYQNRTIIL